MHELSAIVEAKDRTHNDAQGDGLHFRLDGEDTSDWPPFYCLVGNFTHDFAVSVHALAMKRRHQEFSVLGVSGAVKDKDGMLPHHRLHNRASLTSWELVWITGENFLHSFRVAEKDQLWIEREADRKTVAEALGAVLHERNWAENPVQELNPCG